MTRPTRLNPALTESDLPDKPFVDVTDHGATGNGVTNDTAAVQAAIDTGLLVYFPEGEYLVTGLTLADNTMLTGAGYESIIKFATPNATLFDLDSLIGVRMSDLNLSLSSAATNSVLVDFTDTYLCNFTRVWFVGVHADRTVSTFRTQIGARINFNSGDNHFVGCMFANLGVGVRADCIANYLTSCGLTDCYTSIAGGDATGADATAGIAVSNTSFVANPATCENHILIDGTASTWWLDNVWFEGAQTTIKVGVGAYGPTSFAISKAYVAGTVKCVDIVCARQAQLSQIQFGADPSATPTELTINATNATSGFATNLVSLQSFEIAASVFPAGWGYISRLNEYSLLPHGLRTSRLSTDEIYTNTGVQSFSVRSESGSPQAFIELWSSGAGGTPQVRAGGAATNIGILFMPKGSGSVGQYLAGGGTNALWGADGSASNIGHYMSTKGSGRLSENGNIVGSWVAVPATATSTGKQGQMAADGSWLYICTATDTWRRVAIASW
jgi:hypothetical protein